MYALVLSHAACFHVHIHTCLLSTRMPRQLYCTSTVARTHDLNIIKGTPSLPNQQMPLQMAQCMLLSTHDLVTSCYCPYAF